MSKKMPGKIDYPLWLEPPDPGLDEEYDIAASIRVLDEKLPKILQKWPDLRIRQSQSPSGFPRLEILLQVSNRTDSIQALETTFGIAGELGGWEVYDEITSWTIFGEEGRKAVLASIDRELREAARQRMRIILGLVLTAILLGIAALCFGALTGGLNGRRFTAGAVAGSILLAVVALFARRRLRPGG
jgi:hypothetical protein